MSELEKLQRSQYQRRRKALLLFQAIIAVLLVAATLVSVLAYVKMSKETYVNYTENGGANYKVYLSDNQFYTEEYLDENHAYVATLIDHIEAELSYVLKMDSDNVNYKYAYGVESQLLIKDRDSGAALFKPTETIKPLTALEVDESTLVVNEKVNVDFAHYNELAKSFITEYALSGTSSELVIKMYVDVVGISEQFEKDSESNYVIQLKIPLLKDTVNIATNSTVIQGEQKILTRDTELMNTLSTVAMILGIVTVLWIVMLILFEILTRNNHIDYSRRVKKLLSSYKSYIQKINNAFNSEGYQVLYVDTFPELLDIRDTLQMPVLMYENEDQTVSQFFIAAPSKIMYLYEVKVENLVLASSLESNNDGNDSEEMERELDAAYAAAEEAVAQEPITAEDNTEAVEEAAVEEAAVEEAAVEEATVEESAFEEVAVEESVVEEAPETIEEAVPAEENGEEDDGYAESAASAPVADDTFTVVGDDGKEHVVYVRYRKSYMARLIQSDDELKSCYAAVKNELLSYKKVKARVSWSTESFNAGRIKCAKLAIRGKSLWLYLNLDPKNYENTKYRFTDNSDKSKYKDVPFGFKVKSARSLKYARELIADMMAKLELSALVREAEEYNIPYEDTVDLIDRELIKVVYSGDITDDATFAEANIGEMLKNMLKNRAEQSEQSVVQEVAPTEEVEGSETSPSVPSSVDETLTVLDEEGKEHIVYVRYRRSYTARLIQSSDSLKDAYNTVKNELLSYKKLKARISWSAESFNAGRVKCAKLAIRGKALWLYLNLDPKAYEETKYRFVDNSAKPKYKDVPFAIKLKSARSIKYAKELITAMMANLLIARIEREAEDYRMPYEDNLALVDKELIRVAYSGDITDGATFTKANISEMLRSMSEEKQN